MIRCTLCDTLARPFLQTEGRDYHRCRECLLTFLSPPSLPSRAEEKAQYDLHDNRPDDPGYRQFLGQLADPLCERLAAGDQGLDFGCGPGPALVAMMRERGFACDGYDPLYAPDPARLTRQYDFVTCTEVVEHLHRPAQEWHLFSRLVKPGGWLGIMTRWLTDDARFARWHYRRDPTHVCFWQPATFQWLARQQGWELLLVGNPVVLLRRLPDPGTATTPRGPAQRQ